MRLLFGFFVIAVFAVPIHATMAQTTPRQIVTRNAQGPVVVWDATPQLERFAAQNVPVATGVEQIKVRALELFVHAAQGFAKHERRLSVMVVYSRTGALSARYQMKSFEGVGDLLTLEGSPRIRLPHNWHVLAERGSFPSGIAIRVDDIPAQIGGAAH